MAIKNGIKVDMAIFSTDLKYVKQSQEQLGKAVSSGFAEMKQELKGIKDMQQSNRDEILSAKASIKTLRVVFSVIVALFGLGITVYAALR